ncbi:MAG TPA: hypothetical protein VHY84_22550 [Bryobacteraceae bacterium]|nr:hypothetical protein [Bryobacteraceae bacterium]
MGRSQYAIRRKLSISRGSSEARSISRPSMPAMERLRLEHIAHVSDDLWN